MAKKVNRAPQGSGSIRQRPNGLWEARITIGRDPGTGKQLRRSIYGDTQADVLTQLQQLQNDLNNGTYREPNKLTVGMWLDIWTSTYLGSVKPATKVSYESHIKNHLKPAFNAILLQKLKPHHVQAFYNKLEASGLSAKTIRNIHGIFHSALQQAEELDYIKGNPTEKCKLPRWVKKDINVLDDTAVADFLNAIKGNKYETILFIDLLTGMRQSEILGLCWDAVDLKEGTITVKRQLLRERKKNAAYYLDNTKNDKTRKIKPASLVMDKLKARKREQTEWQLRAGQAWENKWNLVFTDEIGQHLVHLTVYRNFKKIMEDIGLPNLRFHDLRHSYAVASLRAGDDIKILQQNMGHHSAAFTLDTYAHITQQMQDESAKKMENYINSLQET